MCVCVCVCVCVGGVEFLCAHSKYSPGGITPVQPYVYKHRSTELLIQLM